MLELEGLTAGYDGAAVIRDINLTVAPGEIVALLGANGAGKTTTLRAVSGLVHPMDGVIRFEGQDLQRVQPSARAKLGIAHVPENRGLFFGLTVAEHFRLGYRGERLDADVAYRYFPALTELRDRRCGLLSGGEQQMLAVGRALARHPKLLLLDELSLGLAPVIVEGLLPVVREFAEESGCGVVLVEQHIALALTIADRGHVLAHGETVLEGEAEHLRTNHDLLISSYFGEHTDLFAGKRTVTGPARTTPSDPPTPKPSRADSSYDELRGAIVRGEIAPNAHLVESDISSSFAMSRGAVRNALIRLEQEGLVVREPHRGARVRQVSDREAVEILQARAVLEGLAVRLTAERIDEAGAERLQESPRAPSRAPRRRRPARGLGRERRASRSAPRALRSHHRAAPDPRPQRPDGAVPVPDDPHPRPAGSLAGGARGDRRGRCRESSGAGGGSDAPPSVQRRRGAPARTASAHRQREPWCDPARTVNEGATSSARRDVGRAREL